MKKIYFSPAIDTTEVLLGKIIATSPQIEEDIATKTGGDNEYEGDALSKSRISNLLNDDNEDW